MPPRGLTVPPPKTESAREARKSFFCELCNKGYSRQNEFQAHESSYDHQHKKRLKDLKAMNRTMMDAGSKARKAEEKGSGLIKIAAFGSAKTEKTGGGFKKGGFKSAFGKVDDDDGGDGQKEAKVAPVGDTAESEHAKDSGVLATEKTGDEIESDTDDDYEYYDPKKPTGCFPDCKGRS